MGDSRPPAALVDLVSSYARRRDGQVEIVLADPETPIGDNPVVVLRRGQSGVRAPARMVEDERGRRLVVTVPRGRNLRGTWRLLLDSDSHPRVRLQARLLVQGPRRPVVLLWGARESGSRLPEPHPRAQAAPSPSPARVLAHKVLDRLPQQRADQIRHVVRRVRS